MFHASCSSMMDDYSQPDFYRFNQDSISLINWVLKQNLRPQSILDLGAGSGIIGIELARVLKIPRLCLVEIQEAYLPHLKANVKNFLGPETNDEIIITSFSEFKTSKFDLIVCNPPYYLPGRGELSKNPQRAIARSFIQDSWVVLLNKMEECLADKCYVILKQDEGLLKMIQASTKLTIKNHQMGSNMLLELF